MAIRVLIADDHDIVRRGLRMILTLDPEIEIVGEVDNGLQAVRGAERLRPDVVLMDLLMPELDGSRRRTGSVTRCLRYRFWPSPAWWKAAQSWMRCARARSGTC